MIDFFLIIVVLWICWLLSHDADNIRHRTPAEPPQQQQVPQSGFTISNSQYYYASRTQLWAYHIPESKPKMWDQYEEPNLTAAIFKNADTWNWSLKSVSELRISGNKYGYTLHSLNKGNIDYQKVSRLFKRTAPKQMKIHKIQRVENPYNYFHGTKAKNVTSICSNNFNWRLHGDSVGYKFGKGVSFSPLATYSSHYCDNKPNCENVMFLARVLVTDSTLGSKAMIMPPNGYDTAKKDDGRVVVKFCDNEFYPEFVIYYTGSAIIKDVLPVRQTMFKARAQHSEQSNQYSYRENASLFS